MPVAGLVAYVAKHRRETGIIMLFVRTDGGWRIARRGTHAVFEFS